MTAIIDGSASATFATPLPVAQGGTGGTTSATAAASLAAIQLQTAVVTTSGTSIDFTGIPAGVKRITIMLNGVSTNGISPPIVQIGSGSLTTAGYVGSVSTTNGTAIGNTLFSNGFYLITTAAASAATNATGKFEIVLHGTNIYACSGNLGYGNIAQVSALAGNLALAGSIDRLRLTTVNGTDAFDAGSVNISWEF